MQNKTCEDETSEDCDWIIVGKCMVKMQQDTRERERRARQRDADRQADNGEMNIQTKTCPDQHPSKARKHHTGWEGLEPNRPGRQYEKRPKAENT